MSCITNQLVTRYIKLSEWANNKTWGGKSELIRQDPF